MRNGLGHYYHYYTKDNAENAEDLDACADSQCGSFIILLPDMMTQEYCCTH